MKPLHYVLAAALLAALLSHGEPVAAATQAVAPASRTAPPLPDAPRAR